MNAATNTGSSSSDRVVAGVVEELIAGRYVPGQRLIESDLTTKFDLSRGPIREALKRLSAERVVTLAPHRGAFIRAFSREELSEFMVVLEPLVGLLARLAAESVAKGNDPKPVAKAYERLAPFAQSTNPPLPYTIRRQNFYDTLLHVGGNRQLERLMPSVDIYIIRAQFLPFFNEKEHEKRLKEYAAIVNAVLEGNPKAAEKAARKHIVQTRKRLLACPDSAFYRDSSG